MFGAHHDKKHDIKQIEKLAKGKKVEKLGEYISSPDTEVALAAIEGLEKIGTDVAAETIAVAIDDSRSEVRIAVAKALSNISIDENPEYARTNLLNRVKVETDEKVKEAIVAALEQISQNMK